MQNEEANAAASSSPLSSSSGSSSPPAAIVHSGGGGGQYKRKPSRNFPGLVKRSHMGSLASIVNPRPAHSRSASVSVKPRRPSSLHIPVTQTLSASSALVSPVLAAAGVAHYPGGPDYPPLILPAAEFAPGNHIRSSSKQGRPINNNNTKGRATKYPAQEDRTEISAIF